MKLHILKPDLKNGRSRRRTVRPWPWLYGALVLGVLVLLTALSAGRGYALGGGAWPKFTSTPVMEAYPQDQACHGVKPPGRLGGDDDDDDDDDDGGSTGV